MLVALKLIEAGAGRGQQYDIARDRYGIGPTDSVFQRLGALNLNATFDVRFNLLSGRTNRIHALHTLAQQFVKTGIVAVFVFPSQD